MATPQPKIAPIKKAGQHLPKGDEEVRPNEALDQGEIPPARRRPRAAKGGSVSRPIRSRTAISQTVTKITNTRRCCQVAGPVLGCGLHMKPPSVSRISKTVSLKAVGFRLLQSTRPRQRDGDFGSEPAWPWSHHKHPIREKHGFLNVMGDEHDGGAELRLDAQELQVQALAGELVERAEGLVQKAGAQRRY